MKKLLLTVMIGVGLVGCSDPTAQSPIEKKTQKPISPKKENNVIVIKEIDPLAFNEYDSINFPKTISVWGYDGVDRIKKLEKDAAFKVATDKNTCNYIEVIGLSETKSIPIQEPVVFVDCGNGQRFYVSEKEIKNNVFIDLRLKKPEIIDEAAKQCLDLVRQIKKDPRIEGLEVLDNSGFNKKGNDPSIAISIRFNSGIEKERARCAFNYTSEKTVWFLD